MVRAVKILGFARLHEEARLKREILNKLIQQRKEVSTLDFMIKCIDRGISDVGMGGVAIDSHQLGLNVPVSIIDSIYHSFKGKKQSNRRRGGRSWDKGGYLSPRLRERTEAPAVIAADECLAGHEILLMNS